MNKTLLAMALGTMVAACGSGEGSTTTGASTSPEPRPATAKSGDPATAPTEPKPPASALTPGGGGIAGPATTDGAKTIIAGLQKAADPKPEMKKLKPGLDELKLLLSDAAAADAIAQQLEETFGRRDIGEMPKGDAAVFCASTDDIKAWTEPVQKNFPGGYKRLGAKLNPGFQMCKFKIGSVAFDSLVNIKGNWFFVPKPFRAIKE